MRHWLSEEMEVYHRHDLDSNFLVKRGPEVSGIKGADLARTITCGTAKRV